MLDIHIILRLRFIVQVVHALDGVGLFAMSEIVSDDPLPPVLDGILHQFLKSGRQLHYGAAFRVLNDHTLDRQLAVGVFQVQPSSPHEKEDSAFVMVLSEYDMPVICLKMLILCLKKGSLIIHLHRRFSNGVGRINITAMVEKQLASFVRARKSSPMK